MDAMGNNWGYVHAWMIFLTYLNITDISWKQRMICYTFTYIYTYVYTFLMEILSY